MTSLVTFFEDHAKRDDEDARHQPSTINERRPQLSQDDEAPCYSLLGESILL
jgi:hypothetical protein